MTYIPALHHYGHQGLAEFHARQRERIRLAALGGSPCKHHWLDVHGDGWHECGKCHSVVHVAAGGASPSSPHPTIHHGGNGKP